MPDRFREVFFRSYPRIKIPFSYGDLFHIMLALLHPRQNDASIRKFEEIFASRYEMPPGVVFCKARMAFYYLLKSLNLKPGGDVLITAIHIADFVNMIRLAGFNPVVVDLVPDGYTMDLADLEAKISSRTSLLLVTHLSGYAEDMEKVIALAKFHHFEVVEDCSQALITSFKGRPMGTFGVATIFSLSLIKPVGALFGGMVISHHLPLLQQLRSIQETLPAPSRWTLMAEALKNVVIKVAVSPLFFNLLVFPLIRLKPNLGSRFDSYRKHNKSVQLRTAIPQEFQVKFSSFQASLALRQMACFLAREAAKALRGQQLYAALAGLEGLVRLPPSVPGGENTFWLFPVITETPETFIVHMSQYGIDCSRMLLSVLSREEAFVQFGFVASHAEKTRLKTVFLPMYPELTEKSINNIAKIVHGFNKDSI